MKKISVFPIALLLLSTTLVAASAQNYPHYMPASIIVTMDKNNNISLTNNTKKTINLNHSQLAFFYPGEIKSLSSAQLTFNLLKHTPAPHLPHTMGDFYQYQIINNKPFLLKKGETLMIQYAGGSSVQGLPHGVMLSTEVPVPVQAQFSVSTVQGNTTISICNNLPYSIPLNNLELDFDYNGAISSVWGIPWLDWQPSSTDGHYVLMGGSNSVPDYPSDPNCLTPITVIFTATSGVADPVNFSLKAAGGTPIGYGDMNIHVQKTPEANLPNPVITVSGMGIVKQQSVQWGHDWVLRSLLPGDYTVSAAGVDDNTNYYQSTVNPGEPVVSQNQSTKVDVTYQSVPTGEVDVSLNNPPTSTEPVLFDGSHGSYLKNISFYSKIRLPQDHYVITSSVPGYSATIVPETLDLTDNASVSVTYTPIPIKNYVGYFETWKDAWASDAAHTQLAQVPTYVNYVMLAFAKPDADYTPGSLDFTESGLEFGYSGQMIKDAVTNLRAANPTVKILLSVGGATYSNWDELNTTAIANIIKDLGLDGVDIDYEVDPGCTVGKDGVVHCNVDKSYSAIVTALRAALPHPYQLTVAGWSTGAYGQDQWATAPPLGSHTGEMLPLIRKDGDLIDMINVMSYDAGTDYDPKQALAAYQYYYGRPLAMGVEVPPEAWGGHVYTLPAVADLTAAVLKAANPISPPGMMIWALQINATGTTSPSNPSAEMMSKQICEQMGLQNCTQNWPF